MHGWPCAVVVLAWSVEHLLKTHGGLPCRLAGLSALGGRVGRGHLLGSRNEPVVVVLGRHALAKFMAVPHYAYLKMKMSGPH